MAVNTQTLNVYLCLDYKTLSFS